VKAGQTQFIPQDPALWELDRFEDFLAARRALIVEAINERMNDLLEELEPTKALSLDDMLSVGESPNLEYKSSLRWDFRQEAVNTALQKVVAKTVAGLMNFEGGTLLIGVADDGSVLGIENDFRTLQKRGNRDGFEQVVLNTLDDYLGSEFLQYIHVRFEEHKSGTVCVIQVERSPKPVYLTDRGGVEFYVRAGNTTRPLDMQAAHDYIAMHWEA
jgi:predicted HTH transcriptional regulator